MAERQKMISDGDERKLRMLLRGSDEREAKEWSVTERLEAILSSATLLKASRLPDDVVTMNSLVQLFDLDSTERAEYWLRYTEDATSSIRVAAVLSNLGLALLGSRQGDTIEWVDASGKRRSKIVELVYQPERMGNYKL